jgi:hypothetical protein
MAWKVPKTGPSVTLGSPIAGASPKRQASGGLTMSAFIVNKEHIDALVNYMVAHKVSYWTGNNRVNVTRFNAEEIGRILLDENVRSVNHRYSRISEYEKEVASAYSFAFSYRQLSPVQIIKAVHCLDYQSCETDDWETTLAYKICQAILRTACYNLPGYEQAQWGVYAA